MRRFGLEALEPRWLLSATPLAAALSTIWPEAEATPLTADVQVHALQAQGERQGAVSDASAIFDLASSADVPGVLWASSRPGQTLALGDVTLVRAASAEGTAADRWLSLRQQASDLMSQYLGALDGQGLLALFPGGSEGLSDGDQPL
jgi:hypothetical protein